MLLGILFLVGAHGLPRGTGGMRGTFLRAQYTGGDDSPAAVQKVFPSESSLLERGRRDDSPPTAFLRPSQIQPPAPPPVSPSGSDLNDWRRRDEMNEDLAVLKKPFYPILSYSTKREDSGAYSYRFETADGLAREETSDVDLERSSTDDATISANDNIKRVVRGWYSYPSPNGDSLIRVDYIADENGFRATQTEQINVNRPSQRLFETPPMQPKPSRTEVHDDADPETFAVNQPHSSSPSIYYRQLGQGGFFYSYRAPNSQQ